MFSRSSHLFVASGVVSLVCLMLSLVLDKDWLFVIVFHIITKFSSLPLLKITRFLMNSVVIYLLDLIILNKYEKTIFY